MAVQLPKTIRQWFTPEQACEYIATITGSDFVQSDLDYFVRDRVISQYFRITESRFYYFNQNLHGEFGLGYPFCDTFSWWCNDLPEQDLERITKKLKISNSDEEVFHVDVFRMGEYKVLPRSFFDDDGIIHIDADVVKELYALSFDDFKNAIGSGWVSIDSEKRDGYAVKVSLSTGVIGYPKHELDRFIKAQTDPTPETKEPKEQSEPTGAHLAVIGAMLQLLTTGKDNNSASIFKANNNQDTIANAIETFSRDYVARTGLSATTASAIFSEANKYLKSKKN